MTLVGLFAAGVGWTSRAPLPEPRAGLIQASIGDHLLVAGGTHWQDGRKLWSSRTDVFDPSTNEWRPGPPLPAPRADSAVVAAGGQIYVIGGSSDGRSLDDVLVFADGRWSARPDLQLPEPRSYPAAAIVDRRVYVFAGMARPGELRTIASQVLCRDLDGTGDWRAVATLPSPLRSNFGLAAVGDRIYLFGGVAPDADGFRNLAETWVFDTARHTWRRLQDSPYATRAWFAVGHRSSVLLLGGYTNDFETHVLQFSPEFNAWSAEEARRLPHGLADARFTAIANKLYVTGGESGVKIRSAATWEGSLP